MFIYVHTQKGREGRERRAFSSFHPKHSSLQAVFVLTYRQEGKGRHAGPVGGSPHALVLLLQPAADCLMQALPLTHTVPQLQLMSGPAVRAEQLTQ